MLLSMAAAVVQSFQYDAYGNAIGFNPAQSQTNRLYNAELYNALTDSIYLRGREYGPSIARLYGLDPFTGNPLNPISFNKYLFGNSDGANNIDPDGRMSVAVTVAIGAISVNVGLTVAQGIYNRQGAGAIAMNVGHNMAIFGLRVYPKRFSSMVHAATRYLNGGWC